MVTPAMPWRLVVLFGAVGVVGGAAFGLVRGLGFVPTLPVAIVEGAILFGVPAVLLGLVVAALWVAWDRAAGGRRN